MVGTPAGATRHSSGVFMCYRSNRPKSRNADMRTICLLRQICNYKTKKISPAPGLKPSTTASPLDNVQEALPLLRSASPEKVASRKFSNFLLRYHCFETRYLFKSIEGWLESLLGLKGILLVCSRVTGATNQSQATPIWAQHACCDKFALITRRKISLSPGLEPSTTAWLLDNVQEVKPLVRSDTPGKKGISLQFLSFLLRFHCF